MTYIVNFAIIIFGGSSVQECSSVGRATVSKTVCRGFESSHSCHAEVVELVDTLS